MTNTPIETYSHLLKWERMQHIILSNGELAPQHFNKIGHFSYKYALEQPLPNP